MAESNAALPPMFPVPGLRLGTVCAGIKKAQRRDLVLMELCSITTLLLVTQPTRW